MGFDGGLINLPPPLTDLRAGFRKARGIPLKLITFKVTHDGHEYRRVACHHPGDQGATRRSHTTCGGDSQCGGIPALFGRVGGGRSFPIRSGGMS